MLIWNDISDQIFLTASGWIDWISAIHPGVNTTRWSKHHPHSVCSLLAHQDIIPWRQQEIRLVFLRQCGDQSSWCKTGSPSLLSHLSREPEPDKSLHDKGKVTPVASLLVSLHLQHHVWFAATKGTCHPPTFCLLCMVYAKEMRSHHKAYRMDTMRHQVYIQGRQLLCSLPTTTTVQKWHLDLKKHFCPVYQSKDVSSVTLGLQLMINF